VSPRKKFEDSDKPFLTDQSNPYLTGELPLVHSPAALDSSSEGASNMDLNDPTRISDDRISTYVDLDEYDDEPVDPRLNYDVEDTDLFYYDEGTDWKKALLYLVLVGVILFALGFGAYQWVGQQFGDGLSPGDDVTLEVAKGSSTQDIAQQLEDAGVIRDATFFTVYARVKGRGPFQAGLYTLSTDSRLVPVFDQLEAGADVLTTRLTIPEGYTLQQMAAKVGELPNMSAERFLEVARGGTIRSRFQPEGVVTLEGLLFPDTYFIAENDTEETIIRRMVEEFDSVAEEVGLAQSAELIGRTPYEAIIIASLVEREAKVETERVTVSGVIDNRLDDGMKLDIDATLSYARGDGVAAVTAADKEIQSPYNTYKVAGLPPTPIAAPGKTSLQAALAPEEHDFYYYVLIAQDGSHAFSRTLAEQLANVEIARANGVL
jgi:UPF0755 protein